MRTFVVSSAILLSVANAMSADPAAISTPPAFTWAGPYAGVNAGYGWAQDRERSFPARGLTVDLEPGVVAPVLPTDPPFWTGRNNRRHGALVGAQIGYNFQLTPGSGWVLGVEADAQLADFGKHLRGLGTGFFTATPIDPAIEEVGPGEVGNVELFGNALRERDRDHSDAFATARLRLGYAFGRWLVFGTGGLAVTETIYRNTLEPERGAQEAEAPPEPAEDEEPEEAGVVVEPTLFRERQRFNLGWTIGAGVEYALNESWTAKLEGLYVNMPNRSDNFANGIVGVSNADAPIRAGALGVSRHDEDFFVVRLGLNYHFGRGGPGLFPQIWEEDSSNGGSKTSDAAEEEGGEDEDDRGEPAGGAASITEDEEGGDKEEGWQIKAKLNRALLLWNDGRRAGGHLVDNNQDSTGFEVERKFNIGAGWEAALKFGFDTYYAGSDSVHQRDWDGTGAAVEVADALLEIGHQRWGTFVIGHYDSASDNVNKMTMSGSTVLADAEAEQWNGNFFVNIAGLGLADGRSIIPGAVDAEGESIERADLRWGDFVQVPLGGRTGRFVTYVTPKVLGFQAAASVGRPQDIEFIQGQPWFQERTGGYVQDAAVRYREQWDQFIVMAGLGVWRDTAEEENADEPTNDTGWGGSFAVLHKPTGLNFAVNYGKEKHARTCAEPGQLSGRCRGDDSFAYFKGGIVRDFFTWGPTALYGEYLRSWKGQNESDENVLRTLEVNLGEAGELKSSVASMWGLGIVQTIKPSRDRNYITDLYVGYRNYSVDLNLIGESGPVASRKADSFDAVMAGIRFRWGEGLQPIGAEDD